MTTRIKLPDFIDDRVRQTSRIAFSVVGLICVSGYLMFAVKPLELGTANETIDGGTTETQLVRADRPATVKSAEPTSPMPPPTQEAEKQPQRDDLDSPNHESNQAEHRSPEPKEVKVEAPQESEPEEVPAPTVVSTVVPDPTINPPSTSLIPEVPVNVPIIAGKTAPHYLIPTLRQIKQVAKSCGGRFLVTDGESSVEYGNDLSSSGSMRWVTSSYHDLYAKRMVQVPDSPEVQRAISAVRQNYPKMARAVCYLSLPHKIDRMIFNAQKQYLGENYDVNATTEIELTPWTCRVIKVLPTTTD